MVDSHTAVPSTDDDVRAVAEPHGPGAREIAALTVFVDRVQTDQGSRVMPKWPIHAVERLAQSLDALALEQVRRAKDAADIGRGAGFPGLALAAALPKARFTLIEQDGRR
jgi:16S rRNA (guanine527-N7)-methyltransferase